MLAVGLTLILFQIWRMEVLPIILILVNVMIIIVVLSSVWSITMISWSSSMLTIWSATKGMEAEGGLEKKDFFEKHFPISSSVTPALKLCDILQLSLKYPPLQYSSSGEHLLQYSSAAEYLLQYSSSGEYLFQYSSSAAHLSLWICGTKWKSMNVFWMRLETLLVGHIVKTQVRKITIVW